MSEKLIVVARIKSNPEDVEALRSELSKLVPPTLKEKGCIQYDLHQDIDDPTVFLFFEVWESAAHLDDHKETAHILEFKKNAKDLIASSFTRKMVKL